MPNCPGSPLMAMEALTQDSRRTLALILTVFLLRTALAITVIPPWQDPDSPGHFELTQILALQDTFNLSERPGDAKLQQAIVGSLAEYGWWQHYGETEPSPLPVDFDGVGHGVSSVGLSPPLYYLIGAGTLKGAAALRLISRDDLVGRYKLLRWVSVTLAVPILVCIWAATRRLFGVHAAIGVTLLTALHPQFVLMSTAVNPDVLVNLCGAAIWWQCARLVTGGPVAQSVVLMACAVAIGILTKRLAAPLVVMFAVGPLVAARFGPPGAWRTVLRVFGIALGCLTVAGLAAVAWFGDEVLTIPRFPITPGDRLRDYWGYLVAPLMEAMDRVNDGSSDITPGWAYFQRFTAGLFNSFWLWAGWLRHPAPPAWLLTVKLLSIGAVAGCLIGARRAETMKWRAGLAVAGALVAIQVASVYLGSYMTMAGGQGRYLFPVIGPIMALFWVGLHSWWPQRLWPLVGTVVAALMFVLDVVGWATVIMPAYLG